MNFTVYIEDFMAEKVAAVAKIQGKTRNAIVREAIEEWCERHAISQWEPGFFDFEPIPNTPDFSEYRNEFKTSNEDTEDPLN